MTHNGSESCVGRGNPDWRALTGDAIIKSASNLMMARWQAHDQPLYPLFPANSNVSSWPVSVGARDEIALRRDLALPSPPTGTEIDEAQLDSVVPRRERRAVDGPQREDPRGSSRSPAAKANRRRL